MKKIINVHFILIQADLTENHLPATLPNDTKDFITRLIRKNP